MVRRCETEGIVDRGSWNTTTSRGSGRPAEKISGRRPELVRARHRLAKVHKVGIPGKSQQIVNRGRSIRPGGLGGTGRLFGVVLRLEFFQYQFLPRFPPGCVVGEPDLLYAGHFDHGVDPVGRPDDRFAVLAGESTPEASVGFFEVRLDPYPSFLFDFAFENVQPHLVRDKGDLVVPDGNQGLPAGARHPYLSELVDVSQELGHLPGGFPHRTALVDTAALQVLEEGHRAALFLPQQDGVEFQQGLDEIPEAVGVVDRFFGSVDHDVPGDDQRFLDREGSVVEGLPHDLFDQFEYSVAGQIVVGQGSDLVQLEVRQDLYPFVAQDRTELFLRRSRFVVVSEQIHAE
mmetsp:Transcript_17089/g.35104  ORF Transcript_17089/g.35104 Transcript_17089/m.35104 type:complete len:346 (+) Transcript_17089:207-1244(+)